MIGFCKVEEKKGLKNICPPPSPSQKVGTGAMSIFFLLHYDNILKHPAKF